MDRKTTVSISLTSAVFVIGLGVATYFLLPHDRSKAASAVKGAQTNAIETATTYLITQTPALQTIAKILAQLRPIIMSQSAPTSDTATLLNQLITDRVTLLNLQDQSDAWTVSEAAKGSQASFERSTEETLSAVEGYFDLVNRWTDPNLGESSLLLETRQAFTKGEEMLTSTKQFKTQMLSQAGDKFNDTDSDGLPDVWERVAGSDPTLKDTDGDGLSDAQEFNLWYTSPIDPDTDADGFMDGAEVTGGYDPLGPGKLIFTEPISLK
jgi:plasmid maintenance system antidote protein VapI